MIESWSLYYHGLLSKAQAVTTLNDHPPGTFLVRKEVSGQLIISYRDSDVKNPNKDILLPSKGSVFLKEKPHIDNVADLVNYFLLKFPAVTTGLAPDNNNVYEEPAELPPPMAHAHNKNGFPPGFCIVCEETMDGGNKAKKLWDHQWSHKLVECSQWSWGPNIKTYSRRYIINNNVREAIEGVELSSSSGFCDLLSTSY